MKNWEKNSAYYTFYGGIIDAFIWKRTCPEV